MTAATAPRAGIFHGPARLGAKHGAVAAAHAGGRRAHEPDRGPWYSGLFGHRHSGGIRACADSAEGDCRSQRQPRCASRAAAVQAACGPLVRVAAPPAAPARALEAGPLFSHFGPDFGLAASATEPPLSWPLLWPGSRLCVLPHRRDMDVAAGRVAGVRGAARGVDGGVAAQVGGQAPRHPRPRLHPGPPPPGPAHPPPAPTPPPSPPVPAPVAAAPLRSHRNPPQPSPSPAV